MMETFCDLMSWKTTSLRTYKEVVNILKILLKEIRYENLHLNERFPNLVQ
jgi:hypothetical protein